MQPEVQERYLNPGEFAFGRDPERFRTLLGSCVSVTFWHPGLKHGAMCHFLLPERPGNPGQSPDGRYGSEVVPLIAERLARLGQAPEAFEVKLFGGAHMFIDERPSGRIPIGDRNIAAARRALEACGFRIQAEHVGQCVHRALVFELRTGAVWMRQSESRCQMACVFNHGCPHAH